MFHVKHFFNSICQREEISNMEKDNTTTRSFRISDSTADKIKEIAAEIGGNQQQTLSKLIEAYELQKGKAVLTDKRNDIETFESYINAITRMYMATLEDNQNVTNLVRTEFEAQLNSKDNVIQNLQKQLADAKETEATATADAEGLKEENARLNNYIDSIKSEFETKTKDLQDMLKDKDNLNTALTDKTEQQAKEITGMKEKIKEIEALKEELEKCKNDLGEAIKDKEQQQLQHEKNILALEKKLQAEKTREVEKYQNMYFSLLQEQQQNKQEQEQGQEQPKAVKRGRKKATAAAEKKEE